VKTARLLKKKIYFYAVSLDIKDSNNDALIQDIFRDAYKVSVRDELSQKYLSRCGFESELVNDPVIYDNTGQAPESSCLRQSFHSTDFKPSDIAPKHIR
jgi:polysaccharide pyruvyl transferase WcaK-like protein